MLPAREAESNLKLQIASWHYIFCLAQSWEILSVYRKMKRLIAKSALEGPVRPFFRPNQTDIFKNRPHKRGKIGL
jgi:hypothetical protein